MLRILVPTDGSPSSLYAIRHVIAKFHQQPDMAVHLLNVQPAFPKHICAHTSRSDRMAFHHAQSEVALATAEQMLNMSGIPYTTHLEVGNRVDLIVKTAQRLACDVIVMGTARKSPLVRLVENSATNQVLERATVPVEVIAGDPASKLERIGIPAGVGAGAGLMALWMTTS